MNSESLCWHPEHSHRLHGLPRASKTEYLLYGRPEGHVCEYVYEYHRAIGIVCALDPPVGDVRDEGHRLEGEFGDHHPLIGGGEHAHEDHHEDGDEEHACQLCLTQILVVLLHLGLELLNLTILGFFARPAYQWGRDQTCALFRLVYLFLQTFDVLNE